MKKSLNTYVIIFLVVLFAWALTWILPVSKFDVQERYIWDPDKQELNERLTLDPESFELLQEPDGSVYRVGVPLFGAYHGVGLVNYIYEGIRASVDIVVFILIIGGAFGIILKTGAIEAGMYRVITRLKSRSQLLIPLLFLLFAFGGATFGMGEEAIPFVMIVVPIVIALGYDAITGVLITYGATQIGFASSWMNPFSIAIAQGIAGLPVLSGMLFRILLFILFTALGLAFTLWYAARIKKKPELSESYQSDSYFRKDTAASVEAPAFTLGHGLILLTILLGIIWVGIGVISFDYYIPEIAAQFMVMGLISGLIAIGFSLENFSASKIANTFVEGAKDLLGAALVVGMARGILVILTLGGDPSDPTNPSILNTILFYLGNNLRNLPAVLSGWFMYVFQAVFNFFVPSGSGKAALTMPLMAPVAQYAGISRQVSVLAFQLGDGFTNMIVPTSGALMGVLAVARLEWVKWFRSQIKLQGILFGVSSLVIIFAILFGTLLGPDWVEAEQIQKQQAQSAEQTEIQPARFELNDSQILTLRMPTEPGEEYRLFLVDSYNAEFLGTTLDATEILRALVFSIESSGGGSYPDDIYTSTDSGAAVTPESNQPVATFTALSSEQIIRIEGYKTNYTGTFEAYFLDSSGKLYTSFYGENSLRVYGLEEAPEFTIKSLTNDGPINLQFALEKGKAYELFIADGFNSTQQNITVEGSELIERVMFTIFRGDGVSKYPSSVYLEPGAKSG
jgi:uncharacterized ion transporter superfamily protein YfcC